MVNLWQQLNEELAAAVTRARDSLVQITNGRNGQGAGTVWHADGLILTNAHVIHRHNGLSVILPGGERLKARLLAADPDRDLAALSVPAKNLPTIELGDSTRLEPGQWVVALGHPWGVAAAATAGTIINVGPTPEMPASRGELIQVGLHLRPGHSGGPLVDGRGRLVGINTMIAGPDVGLAIPLHVVKDFLRQDILAQPNLVSVWQPG